MRMFIKKKKLPKNESGNKMNGKNMNEIRNKNKNERHKHDEK